MAAIRFEWFITKGRNIKLAWKGSFVKQANKIGRKTDKSSNEIHAYPEPEDAEMLVTIKMWPEKPMTDEKKTGATNVYLPCAETNKSQNW